MSGLRPIIIQSPRDYDVVGNVVYIAGVGTGFEGVLAARIRDDHGNVLDETTFHVGGTGLWDTFSVSFTIQTKVPPTYLGSVEVFEYPSSGSGPELHKQVVRVAFGPALVQPSEYVGFAEHVVAAGESLSSIARDEYGDPSLYEILFAANRDVLSDPNKIQVGQALRIPERSRT